MKKTIFTIIFLYAGIAFGQSFEGTLTYKIDLEVSAQMQKMGLTKEMVVDKMKQEGKWADTVTTSYKNGNYYSVMNSKIKSRMIYTSETNKIYSMQDGNDSICTVTDASVDLEYEMTGKKPTIQKIDTVVIVNKIACNIVRVKWKSGTYDYYYNSTYLNVDASLFSKYMYDGWAGFLKISNALPVKIIKSTNGITITMALVSEKSETINEKLFSIPVLVADSSLNTIKIGNQKFMRIKK